MKKNFKLLSMILLTALSVSFISCNKDDNEATANKFVGTWTSFGTNYADMMTVNADGTIVSSGLVAGEDFRENIPGTMELDGDRITLSLNDGVKFEGTYEIVAGETLALIDEENNRRIVYKYCEKNYSNDVFGVWISRYKFDERYVNTIMYFGTDGSVNINGYLPNDLETGNFVYNHFAPYRVFGDLLVIKDTEKSRFTRIVITPNTESGDVMLFSDGAGSGLIWNRVKRDLSLLNYVYGYNDIYMAHVKGLDQDIEFMGETINFAKMDGKMMDRLLKGILCTIEFPNANTIKYGYTLNGESKYMEAPIAVDSNELTVLMSQRDAKYKDVQFYAFQNADNSEFHLFFTRQSFVNFFANMQVTMMIQMGTLDPNDTAAIDAVFQTLENAVESIALTLIFETGKKPIQPM